MASILRVPRGCFLRSALNVHEAAEAWASELGSGGLVTADVAAALVRFRYPEQHIAADWRWVYVARGSAGTLKVGISDDPVSRVQSLRLGEERFTVVAANAYCSRRHEQALCDLLAPFALPRKSEWFRDCEPVRRFAWRIKRSCDPFWSDKPYSRLEYAAYREPAVKYQSVPRDEVA